MNPYRVIQISDTHLAHEPKFPLRNWQKLVVRIQQHEPDLVVHTGDISLDGVSFPEQLQQTKEWLDDLGIPFLVLPGNHDVGEFPETAGDLEPPVCEAACQRFIDCFGQFRFVTDIDGWRLIGANALLFGSGLAAEEKQWQFLENAFAGADGRHIAFFSHKPLYKDGVEDTSKPPRMLPKPSAERLHVLLQESRGRVIASGHLHEHRLKDIEGVRNVWAPSTSFVIDDVLSRPIGTRRVGFVQYDFEPDDVSIEVIYPDDMTTHIFLEEPGLYPDHQKAARAFLTRRNAQS